MLIPRHLAKASYPDFADLCRRPGAHCAPGPASLSCFARENSGTPECVKITLTGTPRHRRMPSHPISGSQTFGLCASQSLSESSPHRLVPPLRIWRLGLPPSLDRPLAAPAKRWWQFLPLGPTGYGDSPYSAFRFAGTRTWSAPKLLVRTACSGLGWWRRFLLGRPRRLRPVITFKNRDARAPGRIRAGPHPVCAPPSQHSARSRRAGR